jgi:CxxC motif-containing protein (DUF1111 family)
VTTTGTIRAGAAQVAARLIIAVLCRVGLCAVGLCAVVGCAQDDGQPTQDESSARPGGALTVEVTNDTAYALPAPKASVEQRRSFFVGNSLFSNSWVTAPSSVVGRDGLGPTFNAAACASCHVRDGRGRPPLAEDEAASDLLLRLSVPGDGEHGEPAPDPVYGGQLNPRAVLGVEAEGQLFVRYAEAPGVYADGAPYSLRVPTYEVLELAFGPLDPQVMMSPRVPPAVAGLGLLEAIRAQDIEAGADPDDLDGDGISGRVNHVWSARRGRVEVGRFGWKANQPDLEQQTAGAFLGDIGVTTSLFPSENCTSAQALCLAAPTGGAPELEDDSLAHVTLYLHLLAVPARRRVGDEEVRRGEALFREVGCGGCHVPTWQTAPAGSDEGLALLQGQTIWPYTDLLLHDMGEGLADGRPDFEASGSEWRTPPLWGLGLQQVVNGHMFLLHDGRARGFEEAILWHGGEGQRSRDAFTQLDAASRAALLAFLGAI